MDKVIIKSNVKHVVGITSPANRINLTWDKKGATRRIDFDLLQDLLYEPGVEQLFTDGYLIIEDLETKKALGLEPEEATEPVNIKILTDQQKIALLKNKPFYDFKQAVTELSYNQIIELANFAIENEIMIDYDKNKFFTDTVSRDVMKTISNLHIIKEV